MVIGAIILFIGIMTGLLIAVVGFHFVVGSTKEKAKKAMNFFKSSEAIIIDTSPEINFDEEIKQDK